MDVLCTSSGWGEAFPNVLGEAMACGVPCVTTDIGDSADIVGESGLVVSPKDSARLAEAPEAMLRMSTEERATRGRVARARMDQLFGLDAVVEQYATLYGEVI